MEGKWLARRREDGGSRKERRRDGEEDPNNFFSFLKIISNWINEGHFWFLLLQLYFLYKITNIFFDGSLNHGHAIPSDIITNIYKLMA